MITLSFSMSINPAAQLGQSGTHANLDPMSSVPSRSVTLHDVAKAAGVSLITASRALGNPSLVSQATIERVQQAVQATGYIPNLLAGGLKSKRSMTVGALVPVISVAQFLPTVQTLTEELDRAGYQLMLGQTGYDHAREAALLDTMIGRRVDGIVVAGLLQEQRRRRPAAQARHPGGGDVGRERPAARHAGRLFAREGRQRGGRVLPGEGLAARWRSRPATTSGRARAAMGSWPQPGARCPPRSSQAPSNLALGRKRAERTAARRTQAFAPSSAAPTCWRKACSRRRGREACGFRRTWRWCGFGDADFAAHLVPSLTTVHIDGAGIGRRAAELIVARCSGQTVGEQIIDVGFTHRRAPIHVCLARPALRFAPPATHKPTQPSGRRGSGFGFGRRCAPSRPLRGHEPSPQRRRCAACCAGPLAAPPSGGGAKALRGAFSFNRNSVASAGNRPATAHRRNTPARANARPHDEETTR